MNDPRTWFTPKSDGLGWTPQTWEGWTLVALVVSMAVVFWVAKKRR